MTFTVTAAQFIAAPYNCPQDNTSDCRAAFLTFKAAAQGLDSVLNVPAGHTYKFYITAGADPYDIHIFNGIPNLIVDAGAGATFNDNGVAHTAWGCQQALVHAAVGLAGGVSARLQTARKGDSFITTKIAADAGLFTVGKTVLLTAYPLNPGPGGDPAHQWDEFVVPTAINTGTGVITLAAPLTHTYLSTFPNYHDGTSATGSAGDHDQGGPATLYKFRDEWHGTKEFRGITFNLTSGAQTHCYAQHVIFRNCSVPVANSLAPSENQTFTVSGSGSVWAGMGEVDKMFATITIEDGADVGQMHIQDPSPNLMIIDNATAFFNGTPRNVIARNGAHITTLSVAPAGFGGTESIEVSDSTVDVIGVGYSSFNPMSSSYFSNGVFTLPKSLNVIPWASPGMKMVNGSYDSSGGFHVLDTTESGSNTVITTDIDSVSLPAWTGTVKFGCHPCPRVRFTNVTGCDEADQLSLPGAYDRPLRSYAKWTLNSGLSGNATQRNLWGRITSIIVNVSSAAAGTLHILAPGDNYPVTFEDGTSASFAPTVDLSVAGEHVIDVSTYRWMTGPATPYCSSTTAHFTIEIITDPGIGRTFVCTFA